MMDNFRKLAVEICAVDDKNVVKVAGIVRKVKNFWKAFQDPEYRDQASKLREESRRIKFIVDGLGNELEKLESAIKDIDVNQYADSLAKVRQLSYQLNKNMDEFQHSANVAHSAAPVEEKEVRDEREPLQHVTREMLKSQDIREQLLSQLPQGYDLDVGRTGQSAQSSNWMQQFSPDDVQYSLTVANRIRGDLAKALPRYIDFGTGSEESDIPLAQAALESVAPELMRNISEAILTGRINRVDFSSVSEEITHRPANQMKYYMSAFNIQIPGTNILFDVPSMAVVDLYASGVPSKKLSVYWTSHIRVSPHEAVDREEKQASRLNELKKYALASRHKWAREVLRRAFVDVMNREPTLAELQLAQAVGLGESGYGRGWSNDPKKCPNQDCAGSNNWGAIQYQKGPNRGKPESGMCPPGSFLHKDSYPTKTGSKIFYWCYKSYPTPEAGAADLIRKIFLSKYKNRGQATQIAAKNNSIIDFSSAMYDGGYYGGFGKTREERIAGHVQMMNRNINAITEQLGEQPALSDHMEKTPDKNILAKSIPPQGQRNVEQLKQQQQPEEQQLVQNNEQRIVREYEELMKSLLNAYAGPLHKMVKDAVEKDVLPTTNVLLCIQPSSSFPMRIRYAHILGSALRTELGAEVSLHSNGKSIEIECDVCGNENTVLRAVGAVNEGISKKFSHIHNVEVCSDVYSGLRSKMKVLSADMNESNFRKYAFEMMEKYGR